MESYYICDKAQDDGRAGWPPSFREVLLEYNMGWSWLVAVDEGGLASYFQRGFVRVQCGLVLDRCCQGALFRCII